MVPHNGKFFSPKGGAEGVSKRRKLRSAMVYANPRGNGTCIRITIRMSGFQGRGFRFGRQKSCSGKELRRSAGLGTGLDSGRLMTVEWGQPVVGGQLLGSS